MNKELVLPFDKIPKVTVDPKILVLFSKPKVGKTSMLADLKNCLIIDTEEGTDYVAALKIKVSNVIQLKKLAKLIAEKGDSYKYIAIDTITVLETMCIPYAEHLYSQSPMGSSWKTKGKAKYGDILNLASGAGYPWLRRAFEDIIDTFVALGKKVILVGHLKDTMYEKNGTDVNVLELDLTGKNKRNTAMRADAIGYLYRDNKGRNIISFNSSDDITCGARPDHLRNQNLVISEFVDDNYVTYWDKIYTEDELLKSPVSTTITENKLETKLTS